jgi:hypothetical protein
MKLVFVGVAWLGPFAAFAAPDAEEPPLAPPPQAAVESECAFLGGGLMVGADHFTNGALIVEGAVKLPRVPLWVHGQGAFGGSVDFEGSGAFRRVYAGLETRACTSPGLCGYLGLDAGYELQTWSAHGEMTEHFEGAVIGPRFGLDAGGTRARFRLGLELYRYRRGADSSMPRWVSGGDLAMTFAYRL